MDCRPSHLSAGPDRGFTVEMIVTIGIIIMAAGFIAPAVTKIFQDRRIENAASVVITAINKPQLHGDQEAETLRGFPQKRVRLYRHPKGEDPGGFEAV